MNSPAVTSVELLVPFHDVDVLGVVWHGHYYKYFEIARTELMRSRGLDGSDLKSAHYKWFVIESKCRHIAPLHYAERFRVSAELKDVDHRIHVAYEIHNITLDQRCAKGHTMLATVDAAGRMLLETPSELRSRLE